MYLKKDITIFLLQCRFSHYSCASGLGIQMLHALDEYIHSICSQLKEWPSPVFLQLIVYMQPLDPKSFYQFQHISFKNHNQNSGNSI